MGAFANLVPELQGPAQDLVDVCVANGLGHQITSTLRSHAQQARLYRKFLSGLNPYPVAPPGQSAHEYGWAFDMVVEPREYQPAVGQVWESWGGTWGGARDPVHFELYGATASLRDQPALPTPETHTLAAAVDFALAFLPGVGEVELVATLLSWGFPRSRVLKYLADPVYSYASGV